MNPFFFRKKEVLSFAVAIPSRNHWTILFFLIKHMIKPQCVQGTSNEISPHCCIYCNAAREQKKKRVMDSTTPEERSFSVLQSLPCHPASCNCYKSYENRQGRRTKMPNISVKDDPNIMELLNVYGDSQTYKTWLSQRCFVKR